MLETMGKLITQYWFLFAKGTGMTLLLSAITVFFSSIIGSLFAVARMSNWKIGKVKPLSALVTAYVEVMRGTPMLVQLYFFYFFLPKMVPQLDLSAFTCIAIACVVNSVAYVCEIIRAGIQAVDKGQMEAARCLGMSQKQAMIKIIIPQATKNVLPALCNEFVTVIKETSIASTFFVGELMTTYKTMTAALYLTIEPLIIVAAIYFFLNFTLSKAIAAFERRLQSGD